MADVAGHWVMSDEMDWYYSMAVEANGALTVFVDRNKLGRCEQYAKVAGQAPAFQLVYSKNSCNSEYAGAELKLQVASYTGKTLVLVVTGEGVEERHTFTRDPKAPSAK